MSFIAKNSKRNKLKQPIFLKIDLSTEITSLLNNNKSNSKSNINKTNNKPIYNTNNDNRKKSNYNYRSANNSNNKNNRNNNSDNNKNNLKASNSRKNVIYYKKLMNKRKIDDDDNNKNINARNLINKRKILMMNSDLSESNISKRMSSALYNGMDNRSFVFSERKGDYINLPKQRLLSRINSDFGNKKKNINLFESSINEENNIYDKNNSNNNINNIHYEYYNFNNNICDNILFASDFRVRELIKDKLKNISNTKENREQQNPLNEHNRNYISTKIKMHKPNEYMYSNRNNSRNEISAFSLEERNKSNNEYNSKDNNLIYKKNNIQNESNITTRYESNEEINFSNITNKVKVSSYFKDKRNSINNEKIIKGITKMSDIYLTIFKKKLILSLKKINKKNNCNISNNNSYISYLNDCTVNSVNTNNIFKIEYNEDLKENQYKHISTYFNVLSLILNNIYKKDKFILKSYFMKRLKEKSNEKNQKNYYNKINFLYIIREIINKNILKLFTYSISKIKKYNKNNNIYYKKVRHFGNNITFK